MVGAARLRRGARRRPRLGQVAGAMRAVVIGGGGRFLRRHRMGRGAALVQRQGRTLGHFLLRDQPVVRRQPPAAVIEGDDPVGGLRRHLPRRAVPRRHFERVHDQLDHRAHHASRHGPRGAASAGRLDGQHAVALDAPQPRQRRAGRRAGAVGPDHGAVPLGRQLDRLRRCICAATPKPSCARTRSTRSFASTPARMCIRSTPKKPSAIRSASSITGSRASTTA